MHEERTQSGTVRRGDKPDESTGRPGFDRRMTREEINALPIRRFERTVRVIRSREEMGEALERLRSEKVLGFDTESRPSFKKGESYPPSLIQLAGRRSVYLFQLRHLKFPRPLREILSSPQIIKAGAALDDDIRKLKELGPFRAAGFVDLGTMAREMEIKNHGLRGLSAVLLGFRISKKSQCSNWARDVLVPAQVGYAAMDAWVSRELYLHMKKLQKKRKSGNGNNGNLPSRPCP
ncbi:MAG: 3'-5' exonuclease domain-containing protein 2 [Deltaproteobacteria bacterium]|nr:3'-5' exonuclease domain-containing protein 2 [Deltaproteobacteria bacterium]